MDNIEQQLSTFGLKDKEIKVYLACMQLGTETAFKIAGRSGVKRATTYLILNLLVKKGLVTVKNTSKSLVYSPTDPRLLLTQLDYRKKELEEALPSLLALYNTLPDKPSVQIFEGTIGVNQIYAEAIEFLQKNEEVIFYGDISYLKNHPALIKAWLKETKNASGHIRELLVSDEFHNEYAKKVKDNGNHTHEVKILPKTSMLLNDNAIFGDKLVIFSTQKTLFAIVIENKEIASTYKTMFEFAWVNTE